MNAEDETNSWLDIVFPHENAFTIDMPEHMQVPCYNDKIAEQWHDGPVNANLAVSPAAHP